MSFKKYGLKVMIIGSKGGREEAIAWKLSSSPRVGKIYLSGNSDSLGRICTICQLGEDVNAIADFAQREVVDLAIVGPEKPLSAGIVDAFNKRSIPIIGPGQKLSRLESSKCDTKDLLRDLGVPVPEYANFGNSDEALDYVKKVGYSVVVKADGLAAGKGSIVCNTPREAENAIAALMIEQIFGDAGARVDIEKRLYGRELSFFCFTDGETILPMEAAQDYKRALDRDEGKNTGGIGAYSPHPWLTPELTEIIMEKVAKPTIKGLRDIYGLRYKGIIYFGLMLVEETDGIIPYVLEINIRLGDPEAQVILPRMENDLIDICEAIHFERLKGTRLIWNPNYRVCLCATSGRVKGKKGWYHGYPDRYKIGLPITGLESVSPECLVFHAGTQRNSEGKWLTDGGRVLGIVSKGKTLSEAMSIAYKQMNEIHFEGIHYRSDIGQQ